MITPYSLKLVVSEAERKKRFLEGRKTSLNHRSSLVYAFVENLEFLSGKRVLEIGGSEEENLGTLLLNRGVGYMNMRLEGNPTGLPNIYVGDFMSHNSGERYSAIFAIAVFQPQALNFSNGSRTIDDQPPEVMLGKLHSFLVEGGYLVIGTTWESPSIFSDSHFLLSKFRKPLREPQFFSADPTYNGKGDLGEFVMAESL
ncbi:hypothetical protein HYU14_03170 [Candidatus Woesearchaeota archaeon]|nr:hypothetical protein [Candidatus Woesearchaeota archaeon]